MDSANFINFIKNPGSLHQLSFQELNSLIEAYPYCQNLHFIVMMKAKVEQHKDFDKKLGVAATYCADRKFLFKQIQDPIRPESTSDSHYGASEISQVTHDPEEEVVRSSSVAVPPIPIIPNNDDDDSDDDSEIPEEIPHTKDETLSPEYISDHILDPDLKIIEDETGSQLIIKKADMPMHPEDEKRKVVYLEDLVSEKEKIEEIPLTSQSELVNEEIPIESGAPIMNPEPEDIDDPELPLEDDDIFAVESDAVSDHDMGIPISEAGTQSDPTELQELPQENLEESNASSPGFDLNEEPYIESELIVIPDHIIDDIPFEITNIPDTPSPDLEPEDEIGFIQEEAFSEEGNDKISEQSTGIPVIDKKIRMDYEEEDPIDETSEDNLPEQDDKEIDNDDKVEENTEELTPLPKIAFKSWPGKFKPSIPKTEELEAIPTTKEIEEAQVATSTEELESTELVHPEKNLDIFIEEQEKEVEEEKRSVDLTEVIKEHKSKKKKKAAKAKKKKKAKKEKAKRKEIEKIEEEAEAKAKKKKKSKDKKKKKEGIKELAQKSLTLSDDIISETLAELLVDQGSNKKAIKMYQKLSLIFPEKSAFFASQIKKLKN